MNERYPCFGAYRTEDVFCQTKCEFAEDCKVETSDKGDKVMSNSFDLSSVVESLESYKEKYSDPNEYNGDVEILLDELELAVFDATANIEEEGLKELCVHYGIKYGDQDTANELVLSISEFIKGEKASELRRNIQVPQTIHVAEETDESVVDVDDEEEDEIVEESSESDVLDVVGEEEDDEVEVVEDSTDDTSEEDDEEIEVVGDEIEDVSPPEDESVGEEEDDESVSPTKEEIDVSEEISERLPQIIEIAQEALGTSEEQDESDEGTESTPEPESQESDELIGSLDMKLPSVEEAIEETKPEVLEKPSLTDASAPLYEAVQSNALLMGINKMVADYSDILWTGKRSFLLDLQNTVNFLVDKNESIPEDGGIPKIKTVSSRRTVKKESVALPDPPEYFYDIANEYGLRCQQEGNKFVARDGSDGEKGKGYIVYRLMFDKDANQWNLEMPVFRGFEKIEAYEGVSMKSKTVGRIPSNHEKAIEHLRWHIDSHKYEKVNIEESTE